MAAVLAFGVVASDMIPIMETMLPLRFCNKKLRIIHCINQINWKIS